MAEHRQQFAKRLQQAMQAAGFSPQPSVLVDQFNLEHRGKSVVFQTASRWLKGEALPGPDKIQTLAVLFGVDPCHLLFGDRARLSVRDQREEWAAQMRLPDQQMLQAYLRLPRMQQKLVRELVQQLLAAAD